jgi:predicted amidohydrolase
MLRAALVQLRSGVNPAANINAAETAVREAAGRGAKLIVTPEATNILQRDDEALARAVLPADADPAVPRFAALARELSVWLLIGSLMVRAEDGRVANRSFLFTPEGRTAATYDKIHLFDVQLGSGEAYRESKRVRPGDRAVVAETPWGGLGLAICYDLRFAYLFRALAQGGARLISLPAAFTRPTGEAHWETLLRARAIETGCFVLAAAQGGRHEDGRATWGHSTVVGPWGEIVAALDHDEPGMLVADLELDRVNAARSKIPALTHDRTFVGPERLPSETPRSASPRPESL